MFEGSANAFRLRRRGGRTALGVASLAFVGACGDGPGPGGVEPMADPVPEVVSVAPREALLESLGDTVRLVATVLDADGEPVTGVRVTWASDDSDVVGVDSAGLATAMANGRAMVAATVAGVAGGAAVEVEQVPASLAVTPAVDSLTVGDSARVSAEAFDAGGSTVHGAEVQWASSDSGVATVDADGWVRATAPGRVEITAWLAGLESSAAFVSLPLPEARALALFFEAAGGPLWKNAENWLTDAPLSDWHGVGVGGDGRVEHLQLDDNGLIGALSPRIDALGSLVSLHLGANELTGPIPPEIGRLTRLKSLDLSYNLFSGPLPPEIGDLVSLERLGLFGNRLTGAVPAEIGDLGYLTSLDLCYNQLSGPIPPEIGRLTRLETLALCGIDVDLEAGNRLTGPIPPEIGALTRLRSLNLGANLLTGPIPAEIGNLVALDSLSLYSNLLTGPIPPEIGRLTGLETLSAYGNRLTGSIPAEMGDLANLRVLNLGRGYSNGDNLLTGAIPPALGRLERLARLDLGGNDLTGEIPPELGRLSALEGLELGSNALTGAIPETFGDLGSLVRLSLCTNQLEGRIPEALGSASALTELYLCSNRLTGGVPPALGELADLRHLHVAANRMSGVVPEALVALRRLRNFNWGGNDGLCVPSREPYLTWLTGLAGAHGDFCTATVLGSVASSKVKRSVQVGSGRLFGLSLDQEAEYGHVVSATTVK